MFTFEELCRLIRVVSETGVAGVEVEHEGVRIRVEGVPVPAPVAAAPLLSRQVALAAVQAAPPSHPHPEAAAAAAAAADDEGLAFVTSPIVGTFYRAPNPDAKAYVEIGDVVHKGQVLCIVEAMKLMNEIESDASGVLVRVYADNAQPVEFGERLFAIRPA